MWYKFPFEDIKGPMFRVLKRWKAAGIRIVYKIVRTETRMLVVVIGAGADNEVYETAYERSVKNEL